jgi:HTH-type transcriptional regulator/antitoxin HipB
MSRRKGLETTKNSVLYKYYKKLNYLQQDEAKRESRLTAGVRMLIHNTSKLYSGEQIGVIIKERRRTLGLTQQDLADMLGCSQRWVWELEQGKESIYLKRLLRLCRELDVKLTAELDIKVDNSDG